MAAQIMRHGYVVIAAFLIVPASLLGQSPNSHCDSISLTADCLRISEDGLSFSSSASTSLESIVHSSALPAPGLPSMNFATTLTEGNPDGHRSESEKEGFHWGRALKESATFLLVEQAWVVHTDFRWVVSENGIPFNHYWRDYKQSLGTWWNAGWSAGEDPMYNYVGHPIQGAITSYIQIHNDPKSRNLEFGKTRAYWGSRLKATIWNTVYSTQWSIGPLSEMTVEKYGSEDRQPWNANGTFPCDTKTCYWGVGKVNLVMTPVGGLGWVIAEDWMDKNIVRRVEHRTNNRLLIHTVRCTFNPIRGAANILHGNKPWFRFRDIPGWDPAGQH